MTQPIVLVAERYRLLEQLGAGGMGRVWLARDEMLRRDVAIKEVVPPEGLTREERDELRLRTLREARAAARLNDANVVRIYDVVHTEQAPWIVMEYVPSRSLHQVITEDGPLPPERVARIGLAVLNALRAAHAAGVLHRDVKPGNVLLADTGRVVLTDFGLAVFEGGDGAVTRPGLILGSPQYISPERAREGISGPESDMWSLGATLYAAVEGRSPYARSTTYATLTALATEEPDAPTRAGVLKPALTALLRKDPRNRAGMAETERLLLRAAAGEGRPWWSMPALPRPRRSREGHPASPVAAAVAPVSREPGAPAVVSPVAISALRTVERSGGSSDGLLPMGSIDDDLDRTVPPNRRWGWVAVGAAALALAVTAVLLLSDTGADPGPDRPAPGGASVGANAIPVRPSVTPSPTVVASIGADTIQLPDGFQYLTDPQFGFRIGLPVGWKRVPDPVSPTMVYYESNTVPGMRVGIDTTAAPPAGDPVAAAKALESARLQLGLYANYHRLGMDPVKDYWGDCADWQFTYDSSQGPMRASNLSCRVRPDLGQTIYWECTADMWVQASAHNIYNIIRGTFRPRP
ncbi:serine/threonine-protein kinase [Dactylosporangium vinaceum]|uniref:non-specific serine/threonine protein kinase n=1 Tax=Dactylosporangium vinaceum TaxID=53362 RepID=A0ABV5MIW6_9ACTN|nr:serine/threonine-protein kinase [Dactylosporangium vinaceum]